MSGDRVIDRGKMQEFSSCVGELFWFYTVLFNVAGGDCDLCYYCTFLKLVRKMSMKLLITLSHYSTEVA